LFGWRNVKRAERTLENKKHLEGTGGKKLPLYWKHHKKNALKRGKKKVVRRKKPKKVSGQVLTLKVSKM